jgi:hypothetical protein
MGQLMNFAFGGLTPVAALADMPGAPVSACSGSVVARQAGAASVGRLRAWIEEAIR